MHYTILIYIYLNPNLDNFCTYWSVVFQEPRVYIITIFILNWTEQFSNSPSFYLSELLIELSDTEGKILSVNLRSNIVNIPGENQSGTV